MCWFHMSCEWYCWSVMTAWHLLLTTYRCRFHDSWLPCLFFFKHYKAMSTSLNFVDYDPNVIEECELAIIMYIQANHVGVHEFVHKFLLVAFMHHRYHIHLPTKIVKWTAYSPTNLWHLKMSWAFRINYLCDSAPYGPERRPSPLKIFTYVL